MSMEQPTATPQRKLSLKNRSNLQLNLDVETTAPSSYTRGMMNPIISGGLDAVAAETEQTQDGFSVTRSGTFKGGSFAITSGGITSTRSTLYDGDKVRLEDLKLEDVLGSGASGVVHKAIHKPTNQVLALKDINVFDEAKRKQILKELEALYTATSPHLVRFYGAFFSEGSISIALEYMDGGSLDDIYKLSGKIPEPILSKITHQVLLGLHYLHKDRHLVHRDIKPSNILMNSKGEFKITDFGVSAELDDSKASCATFVGTVTYMSPERLNGAKYSYESDIWSLGCTVLECATGDFPFKHPNGTRIFGFWELLNHIKTKPAPSLDEKEYSPELCSFVNECLKRSRSDRPSASQLLQHPFIKKYERQSVGYTRWVKEVMAKVQSSRKKEEHANAAELDALLTNAMQSFRMDK